MKTKSGRSIGGYYPPTLEVRIGIFSHHLFGYFERHEEAIKEALLELLASKYFHELYAIIINKSVIHIDGMVKNRYTKNYKTAIAPPLRTVVLQAMRKGEPKHITYSKPLVALKTVAEPLASLDTYYREETIVLAEEMAKRKIIDKRSDMYKRKKRLASLPPPPTVVDWLRELHQKQDAYLALRDEINALQAKVEQGLLKHPIRHKPGLRSFYAAQGLFPKQELDRMPELIKLMKQSIEREENEHTCQPEGEYAELSKADFSA